MDDKRILDNQRLMDVAYQVAARRPFYFAFALESFRQTNNLSEREFCFYLGLDVNALHKLGLCKTPVTVDELIKLASEFKIEVANLSRI